MNTLNPSDLRVNFRIFRPDIFRPDLDDVQDLEGRQDLDGPTLETAAWIEAQADRYRAMGSDLADLVAAVVSELGQTWRVVSGGEPISVDTFRGRCEVLADSQAELACSSESL